MEPKSSINVSYYKNATGYFKLELSEEFPCNHKDPFACDPNEDKYLTTYEITKYRDIDNAFQEKYDLLKKNKKISIINAEDMDTEEISNFMKSQVKEMKTSKSPLEKRSKIESVKSKNQKIQKC